MNSTTKARRTAPQFKVPLDEHARRLVEGLKTRLPAEERAHAKHDAPGTGYEVETRWVSRPIAEAALARLGIQPENGSRIAAVLGGQDRTVRAPGLEHCDVYLGATTPMERREAFQIIVGRDRAPV